MYDPAANTWTALQPLPLPRHGLNVAAIGNRIYVMGGHTAGGPDGGEEANSTANDSLELAGR